MTERTVYQLVPMKAPEKGSSPELTLTERETGCFPYLTDQTFAKKMEVTVSTVHGWVKKGIVPSRKIGRRRYIDLDAMIRSTREGKDAFCRGDFS